MTLSSVFPQEQPAVVFFIGEGFGLSDASYG
jgi:hypothetical protein